MTTSKKIEILNGQILKLQISEASLQIFHISNWKTETLEYLRIFFGESSELYKKCKKYNEDVDYEHLTQNYTTGSALWMVYYTDMLFSAIGILQREIYKKSKVLQFIHGLSLTALISIITFLTAMAYLVGRAEGIKTGESIVLNSPKNVPDKNAADSTANQPKQNHTDSEKVKK